MAKKTETKEVKGLDQAIDQLNKTYGIGAIGRSKDMETIDLVRISSGSLALDVSIGGGYPLGRMIEMYGPESSGKTTLALHGLKSFQAEGYNAAFIDMEHAFDPFYAASIGVDVDNLIISQPDTGEQALQTIDTLIRSGEVNLIVLDSVAACIPKAQIEGDYGDSHIGLHARLMSKSIPKLILLADKYDCTLIFINQLREKIGVMFGSPEVTTGGNALKFYASIRLDIRRVKTNKDGDDSISNDIKIKSVKNKTAPPFKEALTQIEFGTGICREAEILALAVSLELIQQSGAWFNYGETKLGQGKTNSIELLKDNPELSEEIEEKIMNTYFE